MAIYVIYYLVKSTFSQEGLFDTIKNNLYFNFRSDKEPPLYIWVLSFYLVFKLSAISVSLINTWWGQKIRYKVNFEQQDQPVLVCMHSNEDDEEVIKEDNEEVIKEDNKEDDEEVIKGDEEEIIKEDEEEIIKGDEEEIIKEDEEEIIKEVDKNKQIIKEVDKNKQIIKEVDKNKQIIKEADENKQIIKGVDENKDVIKTAEVIKDYVVNTAQGVIKGHVVNTEDDKMTDGSGICFTLSDDETDQFDDKVEKRTEMEFSLSDSDEEIDLPDRRINKEKRKMSKILHSVMDRTGLSDQPNDDSWKSNMRSVIIMFDNMMNSGDDMTNIDEKFDHEEFSRIFGEKMKERFKDNNSTAGKFYKNMGEALYDDVKSEEVNLKNMREVFIEYTQRIENFKFTKFSDFEELLTIAVSSANKIVDDGDSEQSRLSAKTSSESDEVKSPKLRMPMEVESDEVKSPKLRIPMEVESDEVKSPKLKLPMEVESDEVKSPKLRIPMDVGSDDELVIDADDVKGKKPESEEQEVRGMKQKARNKSNRIPHEIKVNLVGTGKDGESMITVRPDEKQIQQVADNISQTIDTYREEFGSIYETFLDIVETSSPEAAQSLRELAFVVNSDQNYDQEEVDLESMTDEERKAYIIKQMDKADQNRDRGGVMEVRSRMTRSAIIGKWTERIQQARRQLIDRAAEKQDDIQKAKNIRHLNDAVDNFSENVIDFVSNPEEYMEQMAPMLDGLNIMALTDGSVIKPNDEQSGVEAIDE